MIKRELQAALIVNLEGDTLLVTQPPLIAGPLGNIENISATQRTFLTSYI